MKKAVVQINDFVLGRGRVTRFKTVSEEKAKELCQYQNVILVRTI